MDNKKILDALHLIQDICTNNECYGECPFADFMNICQLLENEPQDWNIKDETVIWRAFK